MKKIKDFFLFPQKLINHENNFQSSIDTKTLLIFLTFVTAVHFSMCPDIVFGTRIWAEEGERWIKESVNRSFIDMLLYNARNDNFNMFFTNFIFAISKFISLKYLPMFTTYSSYLLFLICMIMFIKLPFYINIDNRKRFLIVLIFVFSYSNHPVLWLNTINSMSYLGMLAPFLLLTNTKTFSTIEKIGFTILIFFCFSTSPYVFFITPFFIIKAFYLRDNFSIFIASLATLIVFYEISIFLSYYFEDQVNPKRLNYIKNSGFENMLKNIHTYQVVSFLSHFSIGFIEELAGKLNSVIFYSILIILNLTYFWKSKNFASIYLMLLSIYIAFFVMNFSFNGSLYGRYGAVSIFLFLVSITLLIDNKNFFFRYSSRAIILLSIVYGIWFANSHTIQNIYLTGPSWFVEYEKYENNPDYNVQYWPYFDERSKKRNRLDLRKLENKKKIF